MSIYPDQMKIITYKDTAPVMIDDKECVIDKLGFKKERQKMDRAHNKMISTKYQLAILKQFPADLVDTKRESKGPISDVLDSSPRTVKPTSEDLQRAIDSPSYADQEYRKAAKAYLEKIIPVVNGEYDRLTLEVNAARAELEAVTLEYKEKLEVAKQKLRIFNKDVLDEYKKFEEAGRGGHTPENFVIVSERYRPILNYSPSASDAPEALEAVLEIIQSYEDVLRSRGSEAAIERQKEYMKAAAASNIMGNYDGNGRASSAGTNFDGKPAGIRSFFNKFLK